MRDALIQVEDLTISLKAASGSFPLVSNLSFEMYRGETLCVVGESGCGKSLTALSIIGLLNSRAMHVSSGRILFEGQNLLTNSAEDMRRLRGDRIAMVFQEPMTSLNPLLRIGQQLSEVIVEHRDTTERDAMRQALQLLDLVRIPDAARRVREYPHQLSGGMRQRVMIAMALALRPALLIADEPTTALDVTIQAQVLALIDDLRHEFGTSVLLITHDLGVVAEMADRVLVLYAGRAIEQADVNTLFDTPNHPYTLALQAVIQQLHVPGNAGRLIENSGHVPSLSEIGEGCVYKERCAYALAKCGQERPDLKIRGKEHRVACWLERPPTLLEVT